MFAKSIILFFVIGASLVPSGLAYPVQPVKFQLPAQVAGEWHFAGSGSLLLFNFGGGDAQSLSLSGLQNPAWVNHTVKSYSGSQVLAGGWEIPLESTHSAPTNASTELFLQLGERGPASLFLEAEHIQIRASRANATLLPTTSGYGGYVRYPHDNDTHMYRAHPVSPDNILVQMSGLPLESEMEFMAKGVRVIEWYNAGVICSHACPPGGGLTRGEVRDPALSSTHRIDSRSFIELAARGGTLRGNGSGGVLFVSGQAPAVDVQGWARLPAAQLDSDCSICEVDGQQTLLIRGHFSLNNLARSGPNSMQGNLGGNITSARLDEQVVDPSVLGLNAATGTAAAIATATGLFIVTKILIGALFTRRKKDVLDHPRRKAIFTYVCSHPGATFREVAREVGLAAGTARHHLTVLRRAGHIVEHPFRSSVRFFENHGKFANNWRETVLLREPALSVLEDWIKENPGAAQKDILDAMAHLHQWSRSTTQHRLGRLVGEGLAHVTHSGRLLHYKPGPSPLVQRATPAPRPLAAFPVTPPSPAQQVTH